MMPKLTNEVVAMLAMCVGAVLMRGGASMVPRWAVFSLAPLEKIKIIDSGGCVDLAALISLALIARWGAARGLRPSVVVGGVIAAALAAGQSTRLWEWAVIVLAQEMLRRGNPGGPLVALALLHWDVRHIAVLAALLPDMKMGGGRMIATVLLASVATFLSLRWSDETPMVPDGGPMWYRRVMTFQSLRKHYDAMLTAAPTMASLMASAAFGREETFGVALASTALCRPTFFVADVAMVWTVVDEYQPRPWKDDVALGIFFGVNAMLQIGYATAWRIHGTLNPNWAFFTSLALQATVVILVAHPLKVLLKIKTA